MTLPLCFFRNVHQSFFGNLTISIICQKTKTLIYLIYDNSDINVKCLVPVNDRQWPPTSESLFLRSSLLPSFDLSLFSSLGSPPPLVIFATYSSLSTCNFIYIVILYLYMKTNSFFFFILSQWLINLWNWNAMIFKTWRTHSF